MSDVPFFRKVTRKHAPYLFIFFVVYRYLIFGNHRDYGLISMMVYPRIFSFSIFCLNNDYL
ncbi:hypothetical protein BW261_21570 [Klebsiella aerogenes]|nr:hypothetical protein BW261_21570 [Klebsiella aerogenes]QDK16630.1 hypothetical protein ES159_09435 [Klebsiella aerogenes]